MNHGKRLWAFLAAGLFMSLAVLCTKDDRIVNGGVETGNAKGRLVKPDGSPAAGAKVFFIPVDHNPSGSPKILANLDSATTNSQGYFGALLDSGTYNMFAAQDTLSAYVESIGIHQDTVTLDTDTLKPSGSIRGVSLMPGQDAASQVRVTIYAPGTHLYTKPDVGGAFSIDDVPEGTYRLIFDPTLDTYGVKVITMNVISGQTTDLDTVIIYGQNLTGMPLPDAGNDTTVSINDAVRLHGSAADSLGHIIKMEWGLAGTGAFATTITGDTILVAPETPTVIRYVLRVEDNDGNVLADTVVVNVIQDVPVANAGADTTVGRGDTVYLHGSKSTERYGRIVKYEWDIGNTGAFGQCANGDTSFIVPDRFRFDGMPCVLRVTDDDRNATFDTMLVFVGVFARIISTAAFSPRAGHSSVVFNNKMWVIGGVDSNGKYLNDVWYSSDGTDWQEATPSAAFSPRTGHASVVLDDRMWVIGGAYRSSEDRFLNDVWFSSDGTNWSCATSSAFTSPIGYHASVVFDNKIWVIGGDYYEIIRGTTYPTNGVYSSVDGINWATPNLNTGFDARSSHSTVIFDAKIWIIAGLPFKNDVWHSSNGIDWQWSTQSGPFSPRSGHTSVVFDNKIWITGGNILRDSADYIWFSEDGLNWTQPKLSTLFGKRSGHTSVIFQNRLLIIGGYVGQNCKNDVLYLR